MSINIEWAFPRRCEFCGSVLKGTDIICVLTPRHIDMYCAVCSKVNHVTPGSRRWVDPPVTEGEQGHGAVDQAR